MDKSYRELFFEESQEYLREINKSLVQLEKNPLDFRAINTIFRFLHTLKGMAATMGFKKLADFAHALEDVFDNLRSGKIKISTKEMDAIFESIDAFTVLTDDFKKESPISVNINSYLDKLAIILPEEKKEEIKESYKTELSLDTRAIKEIQDQNKNVFRVEVSLIKDCIMKGVRALLIVNRAKKFGDVLDVFPSEEVLKKEDFELSFEFILAASNAKDIIYDELARILDIEKLNISAYITNPADKVETKQAASYIKKIHSMRIPTDKLDKMINIVGELAIAQSRLTQTLQAKDYTATEETSSIIDRLISSLQDEALKIRLFPMSYVLDNFPRIIRDLARKEGKEVDLEVRGSEIEMDRAILDELGEVILHLIRNSIDHGMETSFERSEIGKSQRGKIFINVYRERGHIIIEIGDDGRGIDVKEVIKQALEKRLISQEESIHIEHDKILDILTIPGFSTKKEVTDMSGRGVGLDIVKNKLETLGGRIELVNEFGKGCKFILTLPLTLAIIKAMLIFVGEQVYAIPLLNIKETVKVKRGNVKFIKDIEVIQLRDEIIPIMRLDRVLGIKAAKNEGDDIAIVVIERKPKSMGIVVDKVLGEQDIVVKPLSSFGRKIRGVAGATILGNGKVALILDVINLK